MNSQLVNYEIEDSIGIIKGTNPPVNALSSGVRRGLIDSLKKLLEDEHIKGIILCGQGRTFFAGADISEFGKPPQSPSLNEVILEFENSHKPIVAALHGTPLGGGLELAMGCHYRVASDKTMLGLPEVKLGIIPGAGGTQRLPRIVGVEKALNMIISSTPISANEALKNNLVSEVYDNNELITQAKKFLLTKISLSDYPVIKKVSIEKTSFAENTFEEYNRLIKKKFRGRNSPIAALEAVKASVELDFSEGL
jgi:Enoyl-CoA hydratase/carnithine racemase